jgi:hypothetical protein
LVLRFISTKALDHDLIGRCAFAVREAGDHIFRIMLWHRYRRMPCGLDRIVHAARDLDAAFETAKDD